MNNGEQNVSFDRSTPGLAGDFSKISSTFFGYYTMEKHLEQFMKGKSQSSETTDCIDVKK